MVKHCYSTAVVPKNGVDVEYYYVVKKNNLEWVPIITPFIKSGDGYSGEFITANWFKSHIPNNLEYAIIKIETDLKKARSKSVSVTMKMLDYISKLTEYEEKNKSELAFVVMTQKFDEDYLKTIASRLQEKLTVENTDMTSLHITMPNKRGTFGMTFGLRKGENPCMYCPSFDLYP